MKKKDRYAKKRNGMSVVAIGAVSALIFVMLCMMTAAVFIAKGNIPENMLKEISIAASAAGVFVGSVIAAKTSYSGKVLNGIASGMCFFVMRTLTCLFSENSVVMNDVTVGILFCTFCASLGGALIGSKTEKRKRT